MPGHCAPRPTYLGQVVRLFAARSIATKSLGRRQARCAGSKRDSALLRARSRCVARMSAPVRLRANETLQLSGAPSIAVERLDIDTLLDLRRAW